MRKMLLFLLGGVFSQAFFAQTNWDRYLYSYDDAGNIISRFICFHSRDEQNDMSDNENTNDDNKENSRVNIKTDVIWSEVQIEITGEITQSDILSIFTSDGLFIMSYRIVSNKFSLNLSTFRKGTYLFRFKLNREISRKKLIKQN